VKVTGRQRVEDAVIDGPSNSEIPITVRTTGLKLGICKMMVMTIMMGTGAGSAGNLQSRAQAGGACKSIRRTLWI
jgi:hypothetical protein